MQCVVNCIGLNIMVAERGANAPTRFHDTTGAQYNRKMTGGARQHDDYDKLEGWVAFGAKKTVAR